MKNWCLILLVLNPLCALAQGVVYVPSPFIPGQYPPFNQYGVSIGMYSPDVQEYAIDINGDGIVDYTLSVQNDIFDIIPAGSNSVLSVPLDDYGDAGVAPLGAGIVIDSLTPLPPGTFWGNSGNVVGNPNLNYFIDFATIGLYSPQWGTFAITTGFVGLQFWINNQAYYGFLQLDTRWTVVGAGGLYQGYGWNTTPGGSITTTYFRDMLQVPEPSTWALLTAGAALMLCRRKIIP
jgi:hypothetical protein